MHIIFGNVLMCILCFYSCPCKIHQQTQLLQLREENYLLREDVARKEAGTYVCTSVCRFTCTYFAAIIHLSQVHGLIFIIEIVSFQFQSKELEKARKVSIYRFLIIIIKGEKFPLSLLCKNG